METITIQKVKETKNKELFEIDCSCTAEELLSRLKIDENDGSNDIISHLFYKVKPELKTRFKDWSDTWELSNKEELLNLKFKLELTED